MSPGEHAKPGTSSALSRLWASDGFRRVVRTYLFAFLGVLLPGLLGWLNDLTEWAKDEGQRPLPDGSSLAYLGVAAISAGFIALINALWVAGENATGSGFLRQVPKPRKGEAGRYDPRTVRTLLVLALAVALLVFIARAS